MKIVLPSMTTLALVSVSSAALAQDVCMDRDPIPVLDCADTVEVPLDETCHWQGSVEAFTPAGYPVDAPGLDCEASGEGYGPFERVGALVCTDTCDGDSVDRCDFRVQPVDVTPPTLTVATPEVVVYLDEAGGSQRIDIQSACGITFEDNCADGGGAPRGISSIASDHPDERFDGEAGAFTAQGATADWFGVRVLLDPDVLGERTYTVQFHMDDGPNRETVECRIRVEEPICADHVPAELVCEPEVEVEVDEACNWRLTDPELVAPSFPHDRDGMNCEVEGEGYGTWPGVGTMSCTDICDDSEQNCEVVVDPVDNIPPTVIVTEPEVTLEQAEGVQEWARIEELCGITFEDNCTDPGSAWRGLDLIISSWAGEVIIGEPGDFRGTGIIADWFSARFDLDPEYPPRTYTITYHMTDGDDNREVVECRVHIVPPDDGEGGAGGGGGMGGDGGAGGMGGDGGAGGMGGAGGDGGAGGAGGDGGAGGMGGAGGAAGAGGGEGGHGGAGGHGGDEPGDGIGEPGGSGGAAGGGPGDGIGDPGGSGGDEPGDGIGEPGGSGGAAGGGPGDGIGDPGGSGDEPGDGIGDMSEVPMSTPGSLLARPRLAERMVFDLSWFSQANNDNSAAGREEEAEGTEAAEAAERSPWFFLRLF
ncbi:MAG: hypothetical protein ACE366_12000 [Bradymonadia bacterium]